MIILLFRISSAKKILTAEVVINHTKIQVEVADTDEKRTKGLSRHTPLKENKGMLFVFPTSNYYGFWMKDMEFDLDLIWIENFKIVEITENVSHNNQGIIYKPKKIVDKVLEVNAGFVRKNGIKIGDILKIRN